MIAFVQGLTEAYGRQSCDQLLQIDLPDALLHSLYQCKGLFGKPHLIHVVDEPISTSAASDSGEGKQHGVQV